MWCSDEVVDEILGDFDSAPTPVGDDSVTVDCSGTDVLGNGCNVTWAATGGGKRTGDTWTLNVHLEVVDTPDGCYADSNCVNMVLSAQRVADPPTACTYADVNMFEATVSGGPMAGSVPFRITNANAFMQPGGPEWNFGGLYEWFDVVSTRGAAGRSTGYGFDIYLNAIDPKSVPVTVNVTSARTGAARTGGGNLVYYREWDHDAGHDVYASGGGGTVTVQEMSDNHMAGTVSLSLDVTQSGGSRAPGALQTTTRDITGGFYVDLQGLEDTRSVDGIANQIGRDLLNSLRGYVQ